MMHFCSQVVDLPEPVTLDFLDAEVEDSNKQEVKHRQKPYQRQKCFLSEILGLGIRVYMNYTSLGLTLKTEVKWSKV